MCMVGQNLKSSHMAFPYYHRNSRVRDLGNGFVNNAVVRLNFVFFVGLRRYVCVLAWCVATLIREFRRKNHFLIF